MVSNGIQPTPSSSPIGDVAYLARSEHRVPALVAVTDRPRSRSELCELTGVSSSTIRRTLREFEDRSWIRKEGYRYTTTRLGDAIASGMTDLIGLVETERKLRDVWHWLPDEVSAFPVETWAKLTVTVAEPDSPYCPVNRFESLLTQTSKLRFLRPEVALMEPVLDELFGLIDDGAAVTLVDRPSCHSYFRSTYPERSSEMMSRNNFTVLEHDELPSYGVGLLDDRVIISCYGRDSGSVRAVIDTDVPAIREWAESVYASYESDARPLEPQPLEEPLE
ncbi:helix-turn-helix transcriptional regulator [Natrarchaeobaculum sulfurireducens]|uniref:Putative DNA binding protein n=1 Tax=Natrarchaeobaculum sulfurireducens TaxID=2044521 RepID=A0A346PCJ4_9EURY|nr:MarR family transcriptional regulator [Natrarchaeobaculum sulfurireducens]AXR77239.1 Transcriptional regulator, contains HTH domain [Natrarchaeobaculum sulfurireducens]AXR82799.1 putative DNA binding protein [Natrarchaeobaculum sulfurireducens]